MKKFTLIFCFLALPMAVFGQKQRVYFTDKGSSKEMLDEPRQFLSTASIERKHAQGIVITASDLPVAKEYLSVLKEKGFSVKMTSRWFNYALVKGKNAEILKELPFVKKVETPRKYRVHFAKTGKASNINYGSADIQVKMMQGHKLHQQGYTGKGAVIAVLDGGFSNVDVSPAFDSLRMNNHILGTYNFVKDQTDVYQGGNHGGYVLSVMGGYLKNDLVGTAPHAKYWLLTSEDQSSETPVEMDNWLEAAEFADSVGADVINSSLGYHFFDDSSDNFRYQDLDGNTTVVTRAADMAARKGMVVVVSAGNEGAGGGWNYITAPADADSALAVGAVDGQENYVNFSGKGPAADGAVKPDVAAMGDGTAIAVGSSGAVTAGNGTSYSAPLVAGLAACLTQVNPTYNNIEIIKAIRKSASQYFNPDNLIGYGIPNFELAFYNIGQEELVANDKSLKVFPQPFEKQLSVKMDGHQGNSMVQIHIYDLTSKLLYEQKHEVQGGEPLELSPDLKPGMYLLKVSSDEFQYSQKIIK